MMSVAHIPGLFLKKEKRVRVKFYCLCERERQRRTERAREIISERMQEVEKRKKKEKRYFFLHFYAFSWNFPQFRSGVYIFPKKDVFNKSTYFSPSQPKLHIFFLLLFFGGGGIKNKRPWFRLRCIWNDHFPFYNADRTR